MAFLHGHHVALLPLAGLDAPRKVAEYPEIEDRAHRQWDVSTHAAHGIRRFTREWNEQERYLSRQVADRTVQAMGWWVDRAALAVVPQQEQSFSKDQ